MTTPADPHPDQVTAPPAAPDTPPAPPITVDPSIPIADAGASADVLAGLDPAVLADLHATAQELAQ